MAIGYDLRPKPSFLFQRDIKFLRVGDPADEPLLHIAHFVVDDKGGHRAYVQTFGE